ncbi:hypothetical protein HKO22_07870 [Peptoniphilus sp. AGMB00490]|uniref:Lipoprotein n=1 Tax=Peptoniphilus faecalis TaxID=2731255 RepID=A0A848RFQ3_9FIRM|nr:hypothetical protein [Peptoniphilus faecalis]NMW85650.1 hypothetical protein [Peptoniphilus faecalis]
MKIFKILLISLIAILLFAACGKNRNSNQEKNIVEKKIVEAKNKIEDKEKNVAKKPEINFYIARENLGESKEKFPLSQIIGEINLDQYEKLFNNASFTDKKVESSKNNVGDVIISSNDRKIKFAKKAKNNIFENEEIGKSDSKIIESKVSLRDKAFSYLLSNKLREIDNPKFPDELGAYSTYFVKDFFEDGKLILLSNVYNQNYFFKDGIFEKESGYRRPMEFQYVLNKDNNFSFDREIYPQDGSMYAPSVKKMARDDKKTFDYLMQGANKEEYDELMDDLFYLAQKRGLDNFSHKLKDIPGYENDVVYIEKGPRLLEGNIEIAKKKDYEEAKKTVGKDSWPHCEGILYNKRTGIAVKTFIDYFE